MAEHKINGISCYYTMFDLTEDGNQKCLIPFRGFSVVMDQDTKHKSELAC